MPNQVFAKLVKKEKLLDDLKKDGYSRVRIDNNLKLELKKYRRK